MVQTGKTEVFGKASHSRANYSISNPIQNGQGLNPGPTR
jgi:hypothetical protein